MVLRILADILFWFGFQELLGRNLLELDDRLSHLVFDVVEPVEKVGPQLRSLSFDAFDLKVHSLFEGEGLESRAVL